MPDVFTPKENSKLASQKNIASLAYSVLGTTKTKNVHPFSSYCELPKDISFQSQSHDEVVLLFTRRHFITNLGWILTTLLLILFPAFFGFIIQAFDQARIPLPPQFIVLSILFYFLVVFGYAFMNFLTWFYNVLIVTQKEIVDIDYSHLVYHNVAATNVNLVEDVNYTQAGFIRGIFNYGDVYVQTAGGKENIEALAIPKPARVSKIILNLIGHGGLPNV